MSAERHRNLLSRFLADEWRHLVAAVRSWLADTAERDAEDVVQDVAVSLFESADLTAPIRDLSAYVYRALRNRVVDLYRSRRLPRRGIPCRRSWPTDAPKCRESWRGLDLQRSLFEAIDRLPAAQRAVFLATELEGSSFRELAERWEVPIGTLLARKHRAVRALRAALTQSREEEGGTK